MAFRSARVPELEGQDPGVGPTSARAIAEVSVGWAPGDGGLAAEDPGRLPLRKRDARPTLKVRSRLMLWASSSRLFFASFSPGLAFPSSQPFCGLCEQTRGGQGCDSVGYVACSPVYYGHHHGD